MNETEKLKRAKREYNTIMFNCGLDYLTINTEYSEDTDGWNLRDMVAECDYQLSTYYEGGHCNNDLKNDDPKTWRSETGRLKRFIDKYDQSVRGMICTTGHCSKYDN